MIKMDSPLHFLVFLSVVSLSFGQHVCPETCNCLLNVSDPSVKCNVNERQRPESIWTELVNSVDRSSLKELSFHYGLSDLPQNIQSFDQLKMLNLSQNYMQTLRKDAFLGMGDLETLDLGFNALEKIDEDAFVGMQVLRTLNLSHNLIASLSGDVFRGLHNLTILILQQNRISHLPQGVFTHLHSVEVLDLSYNYVNFISSLHFESLSSLKELRLNSNLVPSVHFDAVSVISNVPLLDISNNPLDCFCTVLPLKESIDAGNTRLVNSDHTLCAAPKFLAGQSLAELSNADLNCTSPSITYISEPQVIPYQHDLYLPCKAQGLPAPAVVWVTPWGHEFAHESHFHLIGDKSLELHSHHSYQAKNLILISRVNLFENGTLHISKFRGHFAGNYTCVAINPEGNSSATVYVEIYHFLKTTYIQSLFMSGYSSASFLVFGIIVGTIKTIYMAISRRMKAKKAKKEEENNKPPSISEIVVTFDENDDRSDPSPPKTPLLSPYSSTPESPRKCTTPTEDQMGWLPNNIMDQLDEVRWRLRYGMGRRIEKVRSHVQSIRESSTLYMHNIKESSSCAANRVRTGIVFGVETMKYSVQSLKEFCGTGDMRGQTISMISVSTDVDTEQRTEVIRSVTFV